MEKLFNYIIVFKRKVNINIEFREREREMGLIFEILGKF